MAKAAEVIPALVEAVGLRSTYDLEFHLGLASNPLAKLIRRDSDLSITYITLILEAFPGVNPSFLVTGKGPVILNEETAKVLGLV